MKKFFVFKKINFVFRTFAFDAKIIVRLSTTSENVTALRHYQDNLIPLLYQCENEEEGIRNVVAECLGKLALISPKDLLQTFLERLKHQSAEIRATVITALKFSIVEKPQEIDELIQPVMGQFLDLLNDKDLVGKKIFFFFSEKISHSNSSSFVFFFKKDC